MFFWDQVWFFTNVTNPRSALNRRDQYAKTHVGKGVSIGANATIVCGHDIGNSHLLVPERSY